MSSDKVNQAASITPPCAGENTIIRNSVTSAERLRIPDAWLGSHVTVQLEGVSGHVTLGGASITVVPTAVTTIDSTTRLPTAHAAGEAQFIPQDDERTWNLAEVEVPPGGLYLSHLESATTGRVRLIRSSGRVSV